MKQMEKMWGGEYVSPTLEVLDIAVEQGFATSPDTITEEGGIIDGEWEDSI